jgi:hemolysin activation/secretion protein
MQTRPRCQPRKLLAWLAGSLSVLAMTPASQAQSVGPSQVTPQSLAPARPAASPGIGTVRPPAVEAPAGSDKLSLQVGTVSIEGGFDELADATAAMVTGLEHRAVSVARIYAADAELEHAYARAGFVLVRVTVPPQRLVEGGPVKLLVIDGYIESVEFDPLPERVRSAVMERIADLVGRRHLRLAEIERALLIAGDIPGLRLKSALAPGKRPGGTILVVEGEHHLVTGTAGIDNRLPASLGTWNWNTSLALNSALGFGEQIYVSVGSAFDLNGSALLNAPLGVVGGGAIIPLGRSGLIVNPEYTHSVTRPFPVPGTPETHGDFERWSIRAIYPVVRNRSEMLSISGSFEHIAQVLDAPAFNTDLDRDRYSVFRAGGSWQRLAVWGALVQINAQLSQGLGGRGAMDAAASDVPLSRLGSSPDFTKFYIDARLDQPLALETHLDLIGKAQVSFGQPLFLSEQFYLDGTDAVSAYPNGTFAVDSGVTLRAELSHVIQVPTMFPAVTLSPYLFGVEGWGHLVRPTAVEKADVNASAVGAGVRFGLDRPNGFNSATFGLEVARQFSNILAQQHGYRGSAVLALRY